MTHTIDQQTIQLLALFGKIAKTTARDAFEDHNGTLTFIVEQGQLKKALGQEASTVKKLQDLLKKKIRIIEFAPTLEGFIQQVIKPSKCDIQVEGQTVSLVPFDLQTRGTLIGRAASHLRNTEMIVNRYYPNIKMMVTQVQER
ncbi:MAG: hypothetical protein ACMXYC_01650 [Candidatus Woesearchaeota archaeon]